jgi:hypothetical protein
MSQSFVDAIAVAKGQAVLSATTLGGLAYDDPQRSNGVFTSAVLDGLRREAPAEPQARLTARRAGRKLGA